MNDGQDREPPSLGISVDELARLFTQTETGVAVLSFPDATVIDANAAFEHLVELPREKALGRNLLQLGLLRSERQRSALRILVEARGRLVREPVAFNTSSGRPMDGLLTFESFRQGSQEFGLLLLQDVAEYRNAEAALERELRSFRSLFLGAQVGAWRVWPDQRGWIEVNPCFLDLCGYSSFKSLRKSCPSGVQDLRIESVAPLPTNGQVAAPIAVRCADGSQRWVSEHARTVLDAAGEALFDEGTWVDVTDLVNARVALQQSENLYRTLVESSHHGVVLIQFGRILFANRALGEALGVAPESLVGRNYMDMVASGDQAAQSQRRSERETGSRETQVYEIEIVGPSKQSRWFEVRAHAVDYCGDIASIATLRDITEARRQQALLEAAEERYRLLFQHAVIGMFQTSMDGRVIEVNEACAHLFGYDSPTEARNSDVLVSNLYADPGERTRVMAEVLEKGAVIGRELQCRDRDGKLFWVLASVRVLRDPESGAVLHFEGSLQDISDRRRAEQQLAWQAHHDSLTRLPNRRCFELRLAECLSQPGGGAGHAVLLADLDRFKVVNDSLGHAAGDELLVKLSGRLLVDLGEQIELARYGGDELAMLSRNPLDMDAVRRLARRVTSLLEQPFLVHGHQVFSGASMGIVLLDAQQRSTDQVMRDVDTALYRAKAQRRGFEVFDDSMHEQAAKRLSVETALRFALEREEFVVHYQPIWDRESGVMRGAEALVRWQPPDQPLQAPGSFLEIAEEAGLILEIDQRVLNAVCRQIQRWDAAGFAERIPWVAVNVHDRSFAARGLVRQFREALDRHQIMPRRISVEVTESVFRGDQAGTLRTLEAMRRLGVRLIVDDFGTGYSSLSSFLEPVFDGLKIDRSFVMDLDTAGRHRAIVRTIARFAADLGLDLVAEGVETIEQARFLDDIGCRFHQGYLYARPMPGDELMAWLENSAQFGRAAG